MRVPSSRCVRPLSGAMLFVTMFFVAMLLVVVGAPNQVTAVSDHLETTLASTSISGVVVFGADGEVDERSEPIAGVTVSLFRDLGGVGGDGPFGIIGSVKTNGDGAFEFISLEAGNYQVALQPVLPDVLAVGSKPIGEDVLGPVRPGTTGLVFAFDPSSKLNPSTFDSTISGAVVFDVDGELDETSRPIPGANVVLFASSESNGAYALTATATTDESGAFFFGGLVQNFYEVLILEPPRQVSEGAQVVGDSRIGPLLAGARDVVFAYDPTTEVDPDAPAGDEGISGDVTFDLPTILPETGGSRTIDSITLAGLLVVGGAALVLVSSRRAEHRSRPQNRPRRPGDLRTF